MPAVQRGISGSWQARVTAGTSCRLKRRRATTPSVRGWVGAGRPVTKGNRTGHVAAAICAAGAPLRAYGPHQERPGCAGLSHRAGELLSLVNHSLGLGSENSGHDIDKSLEVRTLGLPKSSSLRACWAGHCFPEPANGGISARRQPGVIGRSAAGVVVSAGGAVRHRARPNPAP